ncbi:MAG: hypothetical protein ICV72_15195, partial [Aldersonia sp.]|nr:hypothetical protein [Aldersonia sp.]
MGRTRLLCVAGGIAFAIAFAPVNAHAAPAPLNNLDDVPGRTSITFQHSPSGTRVGTANEGEARPALSISKLYIVDHALRHG